MLEVEVDIAVWLRDHEFAQSSSEITVFELSWIDKVASRSANLCHLRANSEGKSGEIPRVLEP